MTTPLTLFDKLWTQHEIVQRDGESLLWVDRHYVHEGSFPASSRLAERGAMVAEPELTFGVADHYVPTRGRGEPIANPEIARMVSQLEKNTSDQGITLETAWKDLPALRLRPARSRRRTSTPTRFCLRAISNCRAKANTGKSCFMICALARPVASGLTFRSIGP